jgi:hypothetical protein
MRGRTSLALALLIAFATLAAIAEAEITQRGDLRVAFQGKLSPRALPRAAAAPVTVSVGARIATADGATPPQLRSISIAVNRNGHFEPDGLPLCSLRDVQPATNANALAACRPSLIGNGTFSAKVLLPQSSPFPSNGRVLAFNGVIGCRPGERRLRHLARRTGAPDSRARQSIHLLRQGPGRLWPSSSRTQGGRGGERAPARDPNPSDRGQRDTKCHNRPAILAHVYGPRPIPTSYTIPFVLVPSKGTFGTTLTASLPQVTGNSGYITGLTLNLERTFSSHGKRRSYVSASCPAPRGFALVSFPFARASFGFAGGTALTSTLTRSCRVRG